MRDVAFSVYHEGQKIERELNEANTQLRSLKLELKESYELKDSLVKGHLELGEMLKEANADRLRLREVVATVASDLRDAVRESHDIGDSYIAGTAAKLEKVIESTPPPPVVAKADADALALLLGSIMRDLPTNKDWLDPTLEKSAHEALKTYRNKYQEGNQ
jgi:hypothetical protein